MPLHPLLECQKLKGIMTPVVGMYVEQLEISCTASRHLQ